MIITGIIWLEDIIEKLYRKHNVKEHEVVEILKNHPQFRFVEKGYRKDEDVYAALGQSNSGRYLIVFFVYKANREALIILAREMTKTERRRYEEK